MVLKSLSKIIKILTSNPKLPEELRIFIKTRGKIKMSSVLKRQLPGTWSKSHQLRRELPEFGVALGANSCKGCPLLHEYGPKIQRELPAILRVKSQAPCILSFKSGAPNVYSKSPNKKLLQNDSSTHFPHDLFKTMQHGVKSIFVEIEAPRLFLDFLDSCDFKSIAPGVK